MVRGINSQLQLLIHKRIGELILITLLGNIAQHCGVNQSAVAVLNIIGI